MSKKEKNESFVSTCFRSSISCSNIAQNTGERAAINAQHIHATGCIEKLISCRRLI